MRPITLAAGDASRSRERRRKPLLAAILLALLGTAAAAHAAASGQQVEHLIARAEQAMAANRLTTPAADNAVAYIERVLALSPQDARAMALLQQVVARYQRLVGRALDQGEQARLQSLDRAITFRDRAQQIINKHGLSNDAVAGMDERIAALGKPAAGPASAPAGTTEGRLKELVDQHVALASAFLAEKNLQEAGWHVAQADALAARYRLQAQERLDELRHQVAEAEQSERVASGRAPAMTEPKDMTRDRLTELAAFYLAAENAAVAQGDVAAAVGHRRAAEDLIAQYGLSEEEVRNASAQLGQTQVARPTVASRRVFGTF